MFQSSDSLHGSPSFTTEVAKQADGSYTARCVSLPALPAVTRSSETEAIRDLKSSIEAFITRNGTR